ncbi:hypothetical protein H5410_001440 [Solanum commersonii]|uniref:Uncharacterized protein n=1 Tax=Solanum commersonii TaxID=4109 RepID=A0A9J6AZP3_SOLCO|nr:hypothetical protein H5410_001440 [Solanum commersonii]
MPIEASDLLQINLRNSNSKGGGLFGAVLGPSPRAKRAQRLLTFQKKKKKPPLNRIGPVLTGPKPILTGPDQPDKNPGSVSIPIPVPIRPIPYWFNRYRAYRYGNQTKTGSDQTKTSPFATLSVDRGALSVASNTLESPWSFGNKSEEIASRKHVQDFLFPPS